MAGGILVLLRWRQLLVEINERQRSLLKALSPGQTVKLANYRKDYAADVKERQARSDLRELVDLGYLQVRGRGRLTEYVRSELDLP